MKAWVQSYLRCPQCTGSLETSPFEQTSNDEVWSGVLTCTDGCRAWFPIVRGIPRLLKESLRVTLTQDFVREHWARLNFRSKETSFERDALISLKQHTGRNFGYEWVKYGRFGWDDPRYNIEREEGAFREKSLLEPPDLKDMLVLDAGCGNGRYTYWAARYGATVIGIDLGIGVESAARNTAGLERVQIIQADIFNLPLPDSCFDTIFAIGVLMHTGDARGAIKSLSAKLKPKGRLSVNLYGKGNPIYELVDRTLRRWTTQMSIAQLEAFTRKAYSLRQALDTLRLAKPISRFVRVDSHPHCIFDWYAAPAATHHTHLQVKQWLQGAGLKVVRTNKQDLKTCSILRKWLRPVLGSAETVAMIGQALN